MIRHLPHLVLVVLVAVTAACTSDRATPAASPAASSASSTASTAQASSAAPVTSCAATAPAAMPSGQRARTTTAMVPGAPTALLGCRYHGFNQPEPVGTLAASAPLPLDDLVTLLNGVPVPPPGAAIPNCPADFGEVYVLHFGYADGTALEVSVQGAGCRYVDNGDRRAPFPPTALLDQLHAALGADPSP